MKKTIYWLLFIAFISTMIFSACKKEETAVAPPVPGNEFLTTVKYRFQNAANANDTVWATWKDLSGGANPPDTSLATINIKKSTTYHVTVHLYDETQNPVKEISSEIFVDRANYHTYWFFPTGSIAGHITFTATDHDTNHPPLWVGGTDDCVTDATVCNLGRLEGVLRHQPNSKNGTFAPGSTDSDVTFTVNITN